TGDEKMIGAQRRAWRVTRSARDVLLVIASWAFTAALGMVTIGMVTGGHGTPAGSSAGRLPLPNLDHPFINEQKATIAGARAAVSFPVLLPNAAPASQSNLTQVWVDHEQHQVALVYSRGKLTVMMWPATYTDPTREFRTFIAENHATAAIVRMNRQPALVIQPHTDTLHSNPAWVEFERNGIDINIVSSSYGTDALLAVADSMN
ncbi:MAG: hypothetical protein ACREP9_13715, partial [Candidatus Dormibacteraceae bacterium]